MKFTVSSADLLKALNTVANEVYPTNYSQGVAINITGIAGVRTISYAQ